MGKERDKDRKKDRGKVGRTGMKRIKVKYSIEMTQNRKLMRSLFKHYYRAYSTIIQQLLNNYITLI